MRNGKKRFLIILLLIAIVGFCRNGYAVGPPPVNCEFDLSTVIADPDNIKAVRQRLLADIVPELRGTSNSSKARLRFSVRLEAGSFHAYVFLSYNNNDDEVLIDHADIYSLTDLVSVANGQATSERLWIGRLLSRSGSAWVIESLLPSSPRPSWLKSVSHRGIWRTVDTTYDVSGTNVLVEQISGPEPQLEELLVPLIVQFSKVTVTITDSEDLPLQNIQVYGLQDEFPDPRRLNLSHLLGESDQDGIVCFRWEHLGAVYLLAVRDGVPLKNMVFLPTEKEFKVRLTIPSKWRVEGNIVGLDKYVLAKRRDFAALREQQEKREKAYETVREMIHNSQWVAALKLLDSLAANDPVAQKLRQEILAEKQGATASELLHAADLELKDKNYDAARTYLEKAQALAQGEQKTEITERLSKLNFEEQEHYRQTASAAKLIFQELPRLSTDEVISRIAQIKYAVDILCSAGQISELVRAADQLTRTIGLLDIAMSQRLEEMKRLQTSSDKLYERLQNTRNRLHIQLENISTAVNR